MRTLWGKGSAATWHGLIEWERHPINKHGMMCMETRINWYHIVHFPMEIWMPPHLLVLCRKMAGSDCLGSRLWASKSWEPKSWWGSSLDWVRSEWTWIMFWIKYWYVVTLGRLTGNKTGSPRHATPTHAHLQNQVLGDKTGEWGTLETGQGLGETTKLLIAVALSWMW